MYYLICLFKQNPKIGLLINLRRCKIEAKIEKLTRGDHVVIFLNLLLSFSLSFFSLLIKKEQQKKKEFTNVTVLRFANEIT